jgi:hypothetical protein
MFKLATTATAAAAAFALATPASATLVIEQDPDPCTTAADSCTFSFDSSGVSGMFSETAAFTLPQLGSLNGVATAISLDAATAIDFSSIFVTEVATGNVFNFAITNGNPEIAVLPFSSVTGGAYTLTVTGTAGTNASYGGTLNFSAVPEPGTWALMILGFGAIGFSMRRKGQVRSTSVRYA